MTLPPQHATCCAHCPMSRRPRRTGPS
jgi:hypothetical protein